MQECTSLPWGAAEKHPPSRNSTPGAGSCVDSTGTHCTCIDSDYFDCSRSDLLASQVGNRLLLLVLLFVLWYLCNGDVRLQLLLLLEGVLCNALTIDVSLPCVSVGLGLGPW